MMHLKKTFFAIMGHERWLHRPVRHLAREERPQEHTKVVDGGAQWDFVSIVANQVPLKDREAIKSFWNPR